MYIVDANVLIEAKNRYYAFDIAPGFWAWLDQAHTAAQVCSIEPVYDELIVGDDELAEWAKGKRAFFRAIDKSTPQHFGPLSAWAQSKSFTPGALANFTGNNADYLLVAYARAHAHTVVTHEISQPNARARVLIPDACMAMGVSTMNTFDMLRKTGAQLQLTVPSTPEKD